MNGRHGWLSFNGLLGVLIVCSLSKTQYVIILKSCGTSFLLINFHVLRYLKSGVSSAEVVQFSVTATSRYGLRAISIGGREIIFKNVFSVEAKLPK
jgi:hypothetical protein